MFLLSGYDFFPALLRDIAQARHHIHLSVYIFEADALGHMVADALIACAGRGVEVRLLHDDVGCWHTPRSFFDRLRCAGIEVEAFLPPRFPSLARKANHRNHRKLMIIDGRVGYVGGYNIASRYVKDESQQLWRDTMARLEGPEVGGLQQVFLNDWYLVDHTRLTAHAYYPFAQAPCKVLTLSTSPSDTYPAIMHRYATLIHKAERYIYIETPYFLPPAPILFALTTAANAGVDVHIIVPHRTDLALVAPAMRSYMKEVTAAGVKIRLYQGGFLHSKLMVIDDEVATVGSTNVDFRSFLHNYEVNSFFHSRDEATRLREIFLQDEAQSTPFAPSSSLLSQLMERTARLLAPMM